MNISKQSNPVYDAIAEQYAREFTEPSDYIDEFLTYLPEYARILDAGCGAGVDAGYMAEKGYTVTGIDQSKEMVRLAQKKFPHIEFRYQDMKEIDFPPDSFDGIVAACSLIHIPKNDVPGVIETFSRILKPGGMLYLAVQGGEQKELFIPEPLKPDEKLFLNIMSYVEIKNFLEKYEFMIVTKYEREPDREKELDFTKLFVLARKGN